MAKMTWDQDGRRFYETGISDVALYTGVAAEGKAFTTGTAWSGITSLSESPSGADETALYADNIKYLSLRSVEDFGLSIEAYTYPDEWAECDGSKSITAGVIIGQQSRSKFGLAYKTLVGNDTDAAGSGAGTDGYKLHLVWNCTASPSQRSYSTVNDSPEAISFSWEVTTTSTKVGSYAGSASITIDSTQLETAGKSALATLEGYLYGTENTEPYMPTMAAVIDLFTPTSSDSDEDEDE